MQPVDHLLRPVWTVQASGPLHGVVCPSGAKNAVLPAMAAALLARGQVILHRVPASRDVYAMSAVLRGVGAQVWHDEEAATLLIDASSLSTGQAPLQETRLFRASILIAAPLLARCGSVEVGVPGGCELGERPIDLHVEVLRQMGTELTVHDDRITAEVRTFKGTDIILDYPSVGATEQALFAAVLAEGITRIINAALEPEVLDIITLLRAMGASIHIAEGGIVIIEGVQQLGGVEHTIVCDRLEAGTLLLAGAISGGDVTVCDVPTEHLTLFLKKCRDMGHQITIGDQGKGVRLQAALEPRAISFKTMPHPGFPTDLQAPMMAVQACAQGVSTVYETVFTSRFSHVPELVRMGAAITTEGWKARVTGPRVLTGTHVTATDIRAGAALVLAGLVAQETTTIHTIHHLERGYDRLADKLRSLGAKLTT